MEYVENIIGICLSTDLYSDSVRRALECDGNMLWTHTYSWPYYSHRQKDGQLECPIKPRQCKLKCHDASPCHPLTQLHFLLEWKALEHKKRDWSVRPERRGSNNRNVHWIPTDTEEWTEVLWCRWVKKKHKQRSWHNKKLTIKLCELITVCMR